MGESNQKPTFVITLVANAETDDDLSKVVKLETNPALNPTGVKQANELGERFKHEVFNKAFCSDMKRAEETAQIILTYCDVKKLLTLNPEHRIRERAPGSMKVGALISDCMKEAFNWRISQNKPVVHFNPEGAETFEDLKTRVVNFVEELVARECEAGGTSDNILVVSHSFWILTLLDYLLTSDDYEVLLSGSIDNVTKARYKPHIINTGVTKIRIFRQPGPNMKRKFQILMMNDASHSATQLCYRQKM